MTRQILQFYKELAGQHNDVENIVNACKNLYIHMIQTSKRHPNPNIMLRAMNVICNKYNKSGQTKSNTKKRICDYIFTLRVQGGIKTKMAPIFHPLHLFKLIHSLWAHKSNKNLRILLAKRQAALQAMICLITGRRWTDVTRIKWDSMSHVTTSLGDFIKFLIPVSKTNKIGSRIETITLKRNEKHPDRCPIQMLLKYRHWVGQPTNGFVFTCQAPHTFWTEDPVNPDWSNYRCKGHWINEVRKDCIGHTSSTLSFGYIHRWAIRQNWKILPTKHTFRRTCLITAKHLGISRKQINEGFGWVPHSDMIRHYTAEHDSVTLRAPAIAIAQQFEREQPFLNLNEIPFSEP